MALGKIRMFSSFSSREAAEREEEVFSSLKDIPEPEVGESLGDLGYVKVSMIEIDEYWSATRRRRPYCDCCVVTQGVAVRGEGKLRVDVRIQLPTPACPYKDEVRDVLTPGLASRSILHARALHFAWGGSFCSVDSCTAP